MYSTCLLYLIHLIYIDRLIVQVVRRTLPRILVSKLPIYIYVSDISICSFDMQTIYYKSYFITLHDYMKKIKANYIILSKLCLEI